MESRAKKRFNQTCSCLNQVFAHCQFSAKFELFLKSEQFILSLRISTTFFSHTQSWPVKCRSSVSVVSSRSHFLSIGLPVPTIPSRSHVVLELYEMMFGLGFSVTNPCLLCMKFTLFCAIKRIGAN